ncbi:GNAT family N-acetyltransferase [Sediminicola arcticus]|jgi:GNAT superfamily N-acetyltransferase|uniref:GNAT family N-acetyltransferase n=1 Tax=Sediminicola arcticus TaxID=1574308 RepID=A0ABV2STE5_9FLAO
MSLEIIPFEPKYAQSFKELNIAWLEKYFHVEPHDAELLENCEKTIIKKGGYIFYAKYQDSIVGCFSFIKINEKIYELGKMAVDPEYQGLKIGQGLMDYAIAYAKLQGWDKILLYSNTKLENALYIYKKYGFKEIDLETNTPYKRSNIKMELLLD